MDIKIAVVGDSITQGIGSKKINYVEIMKTDLGRNFSIKNYGLTGTTIKYAYEIIEEINEYNPDIVVLSYGNVDAQIRPNIKKNRFKRLELSL